MVFASPVFISIFMPLALIVCWLAGLTKKPDIRNGALLLLSLIFYAWGEPIYVLLMVSSILINYLLALFVRRSKVVFIAAIALNIAMLAVFKYLDMFIGSLNFALKLNIACSNIALPIGISFYTFQIMSYVIDVRRGTAEPQKDIVKFGAYVSMFPQLIAGPIVRYVDVSEDLSKIHFDLPNVSDGMCRFCFGLAKKTLIANNVAIIADKAFSDAGNLSGLSAWIGVIAYALQIYYDFSGYSDMAIGLGSMLGFRFPENFNHPYISVSVRDFWRRWHITLSTWFRDYLYIPLGGSRRGKARTYINLIIVFALCGLWHGANWSFLLWGLWHGLFLCIERIPLINRLLKRLPRPVCVLYTLIVVLIGWALFRAENLPLAIDYIRDMFMFSGKSIDILSEPIALISLAAGLVFCAPVPKAIVGKGAFLTSVKTVAALAFLAVSIFFLAGGTYNPFIYFRF